MGLESAKHVVDEFRATGYEPAGFTLFSYATVQALAEGVRRAGKVDGRAVAQALRTGDPVSTMFGRPGDLRRKRGCRGHDLRDERLARWALRETPLSARWHKLDGKITDRAVTFTERSETGVADKRRGGVRRSLSLRALWLICPTATSTAAPDSVRFTSTRDVAQTSLKCAHTGHSATG
jgi:hypothetical protein